MRHDYSSRYSGFRKNRAPGSGRSSGGGRASKAVGVLITMLMLIGIAISIWFGWAVRTGLGELHKEKRTRQEISQLHQKLVVEQQTLLKEERIEAAAAKLGLFPPLRQQVYRP